MSQPSGFRSTGHGDDRKVYPVFDGIHPLRNSKYVDGSRQQLHALRMRKCPPKIMQIDGSITHGLTEYDGMNSYAAKELGIDYPYGKDTIVVNRNLSPKKKQWTIQHEKIEQQLMSGGMDYESAHSRTKGIQHRLTEKAYAKYVAGSLHGSQCVVVHHPHRDVILRMKLVKLSDVDEGEVTPDVSRRSEYFYNMYKSGKTVPPILVHKDSPDEPYRILDGRARFNALQRLHKENGKLPFAPVIENADEPIRSRPIASKTGYEQWQGDVTSRWAETLPESAKKDSIPVVENSLGDVLGKIGKGIASGAKAVGHTAKAEAKNVYRTGHLIPPPPGSRRLKTVRGLHVAGSAIGKAQSGVKGFREGVVKKARLRALRRRALSTDPKEARKAKLAIINEFPEYA